MVKLREGTTAKLEANPGKVHFRAWKAMSRGARISLVVLVLLLLSAVFAPLIAPHDPLEIYVARQAPSFEFPFGTDDKGRDVLSRMIYGSRYSLTIGLSATALALVCGSIFGSVAAVSRKGVSEVIMRCMDVIMSFPGIALACVFVTVFGNNLPSLIFAIGFLYIPQIARVVRANVVSEYGQDYVRAVVVSGARAPWILVKHVVRNCIAPVMVFTIVLVADAIVFEASLSFINAGIPERLRGHLGQHPGRRLVEPGGAGGASGGRRRSPACAIMITVLCLNILSEGMTDAMAAAPKARREGQRFGPEHRPGGRHAWWPTPRLRLRRPGRDRWRSACAELAESWRTSAPTASRRIPRKTPTPGGAATCASSSRVTATWTWWTM